MTPSPTPFHPLSCAKLKFLIHCYVSPEPLPDLDNPVFKEAIEQFMSAGVVALHSNDSNKYDITPLGEAWVKAILATPLPVQAFIDSHGRVIE